MNDAPLPTDPQLGAQLARRAVGRVPDDLLAEVLTAVDSAPQTRTDSRWSRPIWRVPRLAAAGIGLTLVVALAVAVAVPGLRGGPAASPAGYPTDRALTTSELAALLAGPALATNTALVAEVTIDAETDVCPMNSYPTIGVIEGMGSQVCVMGAGVSARLTAAKASGTFAFRYLGPGYLGLLGEITPASSSRLAFSVADQWPGADETFLVDGWLGGDYWPCPTAYPMTVGDPLDPTGTDPCHLSWLADDPNAYAGASLTMPAPPEGGVEVGASGMREIDSVPYGSPVHGVFVVRSVVEQCASAPPQSNVSCTAWLVLAKLADISLSESATPSTSKSPTTALPQTPVPVETPRPGYPSDRALTTSELAAVLAEPVLPANATLVAQVTVTGRTYCAADPYASIGVVAGMHSQVCIEGDPLTLPKVTATFALRYRRPGVVQNLGQIEPVSPSQLVHRGADGWPWGLSESHTFLVGGYLQSDSTGSRIVETPGGAAPTDGSAYQTVVVDAAAGVDSNAASQYGVFVVVAVWGSGPASSAGPQSDTIAFHVVARVADISVPGSSASPTQTG